ncbi:MAG TPA: hypothetical protein EYP46_03675 [Hadesarchaea archaeon]|nr:hypothetical protein [Hadesarchaea archaeon]
MDVPSWLAKAAARLALDVDADAVLALTETGKNCEPLIEEKLVDSGGKQVKVILATQNIETYSRLVKSANVKTIKLTARPRGRMNQAHYAMACGLQKGFLSPGERLVCLTGDGFADATDSLMVLDVTGEEQVIHLLESNQVLSDTVELALGLGKGGGQGERFFGTAFVVGNSKEILRLSHQLMINPFENYRANIADRDRWELIKKYANFDGAFVIDTDGRIVAAHRYLDANRKVEIPSGLGTRHMAVAAMTAATGARGITVSGEDRFVRIFERGKMVAKINPAGKILECLSESV